MSLAIRYLRDLAIESLPFRDLTLKGCRPFLNPSIQFTDKCTQLR